MKKSEELRVKSEELRKLKAKPKEGGEKLKCAFIDCYGRGVSPDMADMSKVTLVHVDITCKPGRGTIGMKFGRFYRNDVKANPIAQALRDLAEWAEKKSYGIDDDVQEINVYL